MPTVQELYDRAREMPPTDRLRLAALLLDDLVEQPDAVLSPDRAATVARLAMKEMLPPPSPDDWRRTVGMFGDDPIMAEIAEAGQHLRDAERHGK